MSKVDPIAALLADLDRPVSPRPEFEATLRMRLLAELQAPTSVGGTRQLLSVPARPHWGRLPIALTERRGSRVRLALIAAVLFLLLGGIATAAYVVASYGGGGSVSIIRGSGGGVDAIAGIGPGGRVRTVWRCPDNRFCGDVVSAAWAPDGRRLALSLTEFGGQSLYVGLHIIDTATGSDLQIPRVPGHAATEAGRRAALSTLAQRHRQTFGCFEALQLAWSPDGSRLAYSCRGDARQFSDRIYVIRPDGTHRTALRTGTVGADWPSWSPDGTRIAFSTGATATARVAHAGGSKSILHSSIYVVGLDGRGRRLIAHAGVAPVWSPDGKTIAYRAACGRIHLATPQGKDVTPGQVSGPCPGIWPEGWPVWSPDGTKLAIATLHGIYTVDLDGTHAALISRETGGGILGDIRPTWQPTRRKTR